MRVASFNVFSGRSPDGAMDAHRFSEAVASLEADLLGLQEVDRAQPRSEHVDLTTLAAEASGAVTHRFAPALVGEPGAWTTPPEDWDGEGPAYGVAFVSRYPVTAWRTITLPPAPVRWPHRWDGRRTPNLVRDEPRVALVAEVTLPGGPLRVVTTHLSFMRPWNVRQLRVLVRQLGDGPVLLLGDLNLPPGPVQKSTGMRPLAVGSTFPVDEPTAQIDHVLARGPITGTGGPVRLDVSDHRALVAEITLG